MSTLDFCTQFHKNAYFGGYPNQTEFKELIEILKITNFLDLTTIKERQNLNYNYEYDLQYYTDVKYRNFCILDNKTPYSTESFLQLIIDISKEIMDDKYIYIHCKGGHGRSSLFVACILMYLFSEDSKKSIHKTKEFHKKRKNLKEKYRNIEIPSSFCQRRYIDEIHEKLKNIIKNS